MFKTILCVIAFFSLCVTNANNIQISNVSLTGQNTIDDFTMVQFNLTWENSWRISIGPSNWDAAWVFVKYRIGTGPWLHAFLNNEDHVEGTGTATSITSGLLNTASVFNATTNPAMGVFVHRNIDGAGTFSQMGMKLRWNYGANNIADDAAVEIKAFAIEMVYVPSGSFQVGDGTGNTIRGHFRNGSTNTPFTIGSEASITLGGNANGNLANNNASNMLITLDDFNDATTKILPAVFPKGFNAFYCMKYEISQQQWVDFFNLLTQTQKQQRDITTSTGKNSDALTIRNNVSWSSGDATLNGGTYGDVACNYLSWMEGAAYSDWACLRPMSELEFEKACRGTITPTPNEFAWGTTTVVQATGISNSGNNSEIASNIGANAVFGNITNVKGPIRVGSFATSATSREQAGASYYGIMELSGNLYERSVSVGHPIGRNFTSTIHGNGLLTSDGFCDIATWPGNVNGKVINADGCGSRGGSWGDTLSTDLRTSDRYRSTYRDVGRSNTYGFRAVRTIP